MASHVWDVWTSHVKSSWHIKLTIIRICHFPILYLLQEGYIKCYGWPTFLVYSDISNYHSSWKLKVKVYCYFKPLNWCATGSYYIRAIVCPWILGYSEAKGNINCNTTDQLEVIRLSNSLKRYGGEPEVSKKKWENRENNCVSAREVDILKPIFLLGEVPTASIIKIVLSRAM